MGKADATYAALPHMLCGIAGQRAGRDREVTAGRPDGSNEQSSQGQISWNPPWRGPSFTAMRFAQTYEIRCCSCHSVGKYVTSLLT